MNDLQQPFPPVLNAGQLGLLLNKKPRTIIVDHSRAPHRLPPACTPPGTKSPLWLLSDVLEWLAQYREARKSVGRVGRPTKAEEIAKRSRASRELESLS